MCLFAKKTPSGLFRIAGTLQVDFLMTYDDAVGVRELAERHGFAKRLVAMKSVDQEDATVFVERFGDPNRDRERDGEVNRVRGDDNVHAILSV